MVRTNIARALVVAGSVAAAVSFASQADAAVLTLTQGTYVTLSDLVGPSATYSGLTVGDKTFTGFSATAAGSIVPFSQINVIALGDGTSTNFGLRFQGNLYALPGERSDLIIDYTVNSTTPIAFANIDGDPSVTNATHPGDAATGFALVTDSFVPEHNFTTNIIAYANGNNPVNLLSNSQDVGGVTTLNVQKDIALTSGPNSIAAISFIDQTYGNKLGGGSNPPEVPEPASLGILSIAGLGLLARRRNAKA